jgi:hypothetical protein
MGPVRVRLDRVKLSAGDHRIFMHRGLAPILLWALFLLTPYYIGIDTCPRPGRHRDRERDAGGMVRFVIFPRGNL